MTEAPATRAHARLAPSAAHRWAACPGSVVLAAALPDQPSSGAAMEGTAAHELAAHCLNMGFDTKRFLGRKIDVHGDCTATIFLAAGSPGGPEEGRYEVDPEMVNHVDEYVRLVRRHANAKPPGPLAVEQRVHATRIHPEDAHGTADATVYRDDTRELHVFDLKYGRGVPVEAKDNPQLAIYASGARMKYHNLGVDKVVMHIFQPRCPHRDGPHRTWEIAPAELDEWERELAAAVGRVEEACSHGHHSDGPFDYYLSPGDHCRFCKAAATCPARSAVALETAKTEFGDTTELKPPEQMDSGELAQVLRKARQIQHWIKAVEEHAHKLAKEGSPPTGFKLVPGKATRGWADEEKLKQYLPALTSVDAAELYEPAKLLSPAKLEKQLPKDEQEALGAFIVKRTSGTLLVPEDDPRPAVTPDAADEFGPSAEQ